MRYSTLISAVTALSLFGLTAAQGGATQGGEDCDVYTSADAYVNDIPACAIQCWEWLVNYYETESNCGNTVDLQCLCNTPEPDTTNSTIMGLYEGSYQCMTTSCLDTDITQFAVTVSRFANTCTHLKANGTVGASPSATSANDTSEQAPAATNASVATGFPDATNSPVFTDNASGFVTSPVPTGTAVDVNASGTPTDTAVVAQQTVNAAGKNGISNWEMTVGLPLVAGLMVMQFL